ncbi:MAG: hypothetical protein R2706_11615 [Acidimicrobiales bacterium]
MANGTSINGLGVSELEVHERREERRRADHLCRREASTPAKRSTSEAFVSHPCGCSENDDHPTTAQEQRLIDVEAFLGGYPDDPSLTT